MFSCVKNVLKQDYQWTDELKEVIFLLLGLMGRVFVQFAGEQVVLKGGIQITRLLTFILLGCFVWKNIIYCFKNNE